MKTSTKAEMGTMFSPNRSAIVAYRANVSVDFRASVFKNAIAATRG